MKTNKRIKKGDLEQDKIDMLTKIGWKPHQDGVSRKDALRWEQMYASLVEYKKQKGNCDVPHTYPQNQKLANWATSQRSMFSQKRMSQYRIDKLQALGFSLKMFERERKRKAAWMVGSCFLHNCTLPPICHLTFLFGVM